MAAKFPAGEYEDICRLLGHAVVAWNFAEHHLDYQIALVYHRFAGYRIDLELPRGTKRRIDFLRKSFRDIRELRGLYDEARPLLDRCAKIARIRNTIAHGLIHGYEAKTQTLSFIMLDATGDMHAEVPRPYTLKQILDAADDCIAVSTAMAALFDKIEKVPVPTYKINKRFSKLLVRLTRKLKLKKTITNRLLQLG